MNIRQLLNRSQQISIGTTSQLPNHQSNKYYTQSNITTYNNQSLDIKNFSLASHPNLSTTTLNNSKILKEINQKSMEDNDRMQTLRRNQNESLMLKKTIEQEIRQCKNCHKIYYFKYEYNHHQIKQKYFCQKCIQSLKFKETKNDLKKNKQTRKLKNNREIIKLLKTLPDNSISIESDRVEFMLKYPFYITRNNINFPIQDTLFDQYQSILPAIQSNPQKPIPTQFLGNHFGTILQLWNTIKAFPQYFSIEKDCSPKDLSSALLHPDSLCFTQGIYIHLLSFFIDEIFNDKFQISKYYMKNPFLIVLKFCKQNNQFDQIFRFVWIQFIYQLSTIEQFQNMFKKNQEFIGLIIKLKNKSNEFFLPTDINQRIFLLKCLLEGILDTSVFREKLNENGQHQQVNENEQMLKKQQAILNANNENIIKLQQELNEKQKYISIDFENDIKKKISEQIKMINNQIKSNHQKKEKAIKNIQTYKSNLEQSSTRNNHNNIVLMGLDKQKTQYWLILNEKDKLYCHTQNEQWFYYDYHKVVNELLNSLNIRGVRQNNLYYNIINHKNSDNFQQSHNKHQNNQTPIYITMQNKYIEEMNEYKKIKKFNFETERYISFPFLKKMIQLAQKKISSYFDFIHARWADLQDRQLYLTKMRKSNSFQQILDEVKNFNENIYVVQIDKTIFDQISQKIDSKTRKIQTKIWGIKKLYKDAWTQYANNCNCLLEIFFLVGTMYLNIQRYVKKMRDTKNQQDDVPFIKINHKKKTIQKQKQSACYICHKNNQQTLVTCDLCMKIFHYKCLRISILPKGKYNCKDCFQKRKTRSQIKKI